MRLAGKVALVSGAGGGFGEGTARRFAEKGAKVAVVDLRRDAAEAVARSMGLAAIPVTAGRLSRADDVANAALDLTLDEAAFITGVEPPVDGGRTV